MCPAQNESAGKRKSSRLRKGTPPPPPWSNTSSPATKDSYYKAQFNRLRSRRGPKKAICAVAASMLTAIYHMLKDGTFHQDLGADHFDRRSTEVKAKRLARSSQSLATKSRFSPSHRRHDVLSLPSTSEFCLTAGLARRQTRPGRGGRLDPMVLVSSES